MARSPARGSGVLKGQSTCSDSPSLELPEEYARGHASYSLKIDLVHLMLYQACVRKLKCQAGPSWVSRASQNLS